MILRWSLKSFISMKALHVAAVSLNLDAADNLYFIIFSLTGGHRNSFQGEEPVSVRGEATAKLTYFYRLFLIPASDLIQKLLSSACMYFECPPAKSSD